jgi:hypothetical protein
MLGIELLPGSQLSDTEAVTDTIAKRLGSWPEVAGIFVDGGRMPSGFSRRGRQGGHHY